MKKLILLTVSVLMGGSAFANKPIDCSLIKDQSSKIKCEERVKKLNEKKDKVSNHLHEKKEEIKTKVAEVQSKGSDKTEEKKVELKKEENKEIELKK
jgi:vacuolar-type H+-ATPase subunit I/STV1